MRDKWTGVLIGKMHNANITLEDLAEELGVTKGYVSMILNGRRRPPEAKKRMQAAYESIVQRREGEG